MTSWKIRDFHSQDVEGILQLWQSLRATKVEPVYDLSEVLASCEKDHAVVAVQGEQIIGAAVGRAAHDQGWIVFLSTLPDFRGRGIGTSLLAAVFDEAGLDATVIIGGRLNSYGANARLGEGKYLLAEADESDGSFLCLFSIVNVITNVDLDHVDHYHNIGAIDAAFIQFANAVPFYGLNVVCGDDPGVKRILPHVKRRVLTYGFGKDNHIRAKVLSEGESSLFRVFVNGELMGTVELFQPGRHNILNALATIGVALETGISAEDCINGLAKFNGVGRRFERKGERGGVTVIDDYGHHPAEIAATLATARQVFPGRRLVVAFQPHRFTRTQALFGDFCKVFGNVDKLLLTEIYPASESPIPGVSGQSLAQGIRQVSNTDVAYFQDFAAINEALPELLKAGDVFITLGAGNIWTVGQHYLENRS